MDRNVAIACFLCSSWAFDRVLHRQLESWEIGFLFFSTKRLMRDAMLCQHWVGVGICWFYIHLRRNLLPVRYFDSCSLRIHRCLPVLLAASLARDQVVTLPLVPALGSLSFPHIFPDHRSPVLDPPAAFIHLLVVCSLFFFPCISCIALITYLLPRIFLVCDAL